MDQPAEEIPFPVGDLCAKEGSYKASFRYGEGDYVDAVELVRERKVKLSELITGRYGFEDAERAFKDVGKDGGIKSVISGPGVEVEHKD